MKRGLLLLTWLWLANSAFAEIKPARFDAAAIRDASSLDVRVVQDWRIADREPSVRQKLVEITVCEWWPGQKVRIPVTLNVPAGAGPCRNVVVGNMGLVMRPALPGGAMLRLLKEANVGVVLVGMGTIDAMQPAGQLHLGMQEQMLKTKDARFTPGWIWGVSDMRGLTLAVSEREYFQPEKVLATGGSKRGVAAATAGIQDDRFTAIMPVVAPPMGSPGGAYVLGTDPAEITRANEQFLLDLSKGKHPELPGTARAALLDRQVRRGDERIANEQAAKAGWTTADVEELNKRAWDFCHVATHWEACRKRGLDVFYNVGTNDSVSPALVELGDRWPEFPIFIVPGGQHGGPKGAGFSQQVPTLAEVDDNLYAFSQQHFFGKPPAIVTPRIETMLDAQKQVMRVRVSFADGSEPQTNELSWSVNRHAPFTLAFEYDRWNSQPLQKDGPGQFSGQIPLAKTYESVEMVTTHTRRVEDRSLSVSSPLVRMRVR